MSKRRAGPSTGSMTPIQYSGKPSWRRASFPTLLRTFRHALSDEYDIGIEAWVVCFCMLLEKHNSWLEIPIIGPARFGCAARNSSRFSEVGDICTTPNRPNLFQETGT